MKFANAYGEGEQWQGGVHDGIPGGASASSRIKAVQKGIAHPPHSRHPLGTNHRSRNCWVSAPAWQARLTKDIVDGDVIDVDKAKLQ